MHTRIVPALALCAALFTAAAASGGATDAKSYHFGTHTKHTNVTFTSEADLENIYGMTNVASGSVVLDFVDKKGSAAITVPVKHMKTGIEARDGHLRNDQWLDEAKYPDLTFTADSFALVEKNKDKGIWEAEVKGRFTAHGVTRDLTTTARIVAVPDARAAEILGKGSWVRVTTSFDVKLSDHGVKIPDGPVSGKVNDTWAVKFDCYASTEKGK